jgi:hypothetical protein
MQERADTAKQLLEASGGVPETKPTPLETAIDLVSRPGYAVAGFTEEASTTGDMRAAFSRASDEFFSTEKAQKERFGEVLGTIGVPDLGHISSLAPWLYNETGEGWKFKKEGTADISGRGTMGFLMDVPFDPLTYIGLGPVHPTGLVQRGGRLVGEVALTRAGQKEAARIAATETPKAAAFVQSVIEPIRKRYIGKLAVPEDVPFSFVRSKTEKALEGLVSIAKQEQETIARRLAQEPLNPAIMAEETLARSRVSQLAQQLDATSGAIEAQARKTVRPRGFEPMTSEEALLAAREIDFYAANVAEQAALSRIDDLVKGGRSKWIDTSVMRFMGQPLLDKELFKPIGMVASRMARHIEEMPLGAQILSGTRVIGKGLDALFNETSRAAGKHPGVKEAKSLFHAETRLGRKHLEQAIATFAPKTLIRSALPEGPVRWAGGEVKDVGEYLALHLDDPVRFPIDKLPPAAADQIPHIRQLTAEMFNEEARRDLIDPRAFRQNYLAHFFDNTDEELEQLSSLYRSRRGAGFNETFSNGPFREQRTFPTLTDAVEFANTLKREGITKFDLKPNLDIQDVLFKRGLGHTHAIAAETFKIRAWQAMGIDPWKIGEETFAHVYPEIAHMLKEEVERQALSLPPQLRNKFARLPPTQMLRKRLGIEPPPATPQIDFLSELFPTRRGQALSKAQKAVEREGRRITRLMDQIEILKKSTDPGAAERIAVKERTIQRAQGKAKKLRDAFGAAEEMRPSPDGAVHVGKLLARAFAGKPVNTSGLTPELKALYWMGRLTHVRDLRQLQGMMTRHYDEISELDPNILTKVREMVGISRRKVLNQFNEPFKLVKLPKKEWRKNEPQRAIYLPPSVAAEVEKLSEGVLNKKEVKGILAAFDFIQDWFKTSATVLFPAFHTRNAYSNVAQNFAALGLRAFNPATMFRTAAIMGGAEGSLSTPLRNYTFEEVRTLFERHGLETSGAQLTERIAKTNIILDNIATKTARGVGAKIENSAKLMSFVGHLEQGLTPAQAALRVQKFLFDYDALSPWERDVFRRIIPFYTWTSKNLRLYADVIRHNPGRVAAMLKTADEDKGPERDMLPEYLRGDFKLKLKQDGKITYVTGIDLPASQAIETAFGSSGRNAFNQWLSMLTPAIKMFVELGFGRESFTGRSLEERQQLGDFIGGMMMKLPQPVQKWMELRKEVDEGGETWYNMNGTKAYLLFKSYVLSRIFSSVRGLEDDNFKQWAIDNLTGVRLKEFDLTQAQVKILRNRLKEWERELLSRGVLYPGRPFLPKTSPYREEK